jgi:carboxymethylenebutenolidase
MADTRTDTITVADGSFDAHVVLPEGGTGPGLLLIQEIFGVGAYIKAVAQRLADLGYVVVAPDVFWRFKPGHAADHDEAGLAESFAAMEQLDFPQAVQDLLAALSHLDDLPETVGGVGVIGFCLGGALGYEVAVAGEPACVISYYGSGIADRLDAADQIACPILFHYGDSDPFIPNEQSEAVAAKFASNDTATVLVKAGAGHAFDNHEAAQFHNPTAAAAAWDETVAFLRQHLPVARP